MTRTPVLLLDGLSASELKAIQRRMKPRRFRAGELICRQGDLGSSLFLIQSGLARVVVDTGDARASLALLRRGEVVGEVSVLTGEPHSATVVAAAPTETLELSREGLVDVLPRSPLILKNLTAILSQRLTRTTAELSAPRRRGEVV